MTPLSATNDVASANRLGLFRGMLVCIAVLYPAWYYVAVLAIPDAIDGMQGRLFVALFSVVILIGSFVSSSVRKYQETLFLIAGLVLMGHVTWLSDINRLSYVYVFGPFLAFFALSMGFDSRRHLIAFLLATIAMAFFVNGEGTHISKGFYLSFMVTGAICSLVTSLTRMSYVRHIRRQKEDLDRSNHALQDALNITKTFFANTSHELRTPLALIMGHAEALRERLEADHAADLSLRVIEQNAGDLLGHVNNILDLTRLEACGLTIAPAWFDLMNVLKTQHDSWRLVLERKNIEFDLRTTASVVEVGLDYDKTERIITNLLSNAIKFTPAGGKVSIDCQAAEDHVVLRFQDSGPGIPQASKEKVFEPFVRLEDKAHNIGGTGLGLAIVREFTRRQQGRIVVEDSPGGGSTFVVTLPRRLEGPIKETVSTKQVAPRSPQTSVPKGLDRPVSPFRILFVEDNAELLNFLWSTFSSEFAVLLAENGKTAFEVLEKEQVDLVISDIMMPEMDGIELFERVRADSRFVALPFVFLTAREDHELQDALIEKGAQDFIAKPFVIAEVRQRILAHMHMRIGLVTELEARNRVIAEEKQRVDDLCLRLEVALSAAESASRAKTQFLANMSHELRTPLSSVSGFADLLILDELTREQREFAECIRRSTATMVRLVDDILLAAKIESDQFRVERCEFAVSDLLQELKAMLTEGCAPKNLDCRFDAQNLPRMLVSDRARIQQVVANLISNAVKFTEAGQVELLVSCEVGANSGKVLRFRVTDSGIGINDESLGRLFKPFEQADNSNTRRFDGTGLGLYISRRIARALGGDVWFEQNADYQGATFVCEFEVETIDAQDPSFNYHRRMSTPLSQPVDRL